MSHPASERFHAILAEMGELHNAKQADYGQDDDPLANVRASEEWGMPAWVGAMVRLTDKVRRLQTFADKGELANESAIDSFNDIAVYAVISRVLFEQDLDAEADRNAQAPDTSLPDLPADPRRPLDFHSLPDARRPDLLDTDSEAHREWRRERGYIDQAVAPDVHDCSECGGLAHGGECDNCSLVF